MADCNQITIIWLEIRQQDINDGTLFTKGKRTFSNHMLNLNEEQKGMVAIKYDKQEKLEVYHTMKIKGFYK